MRHYGVFAQRGRLEEVRDLRDRLADDRASENMTDFRVKEKLLGGLWGAVAGDALGVPVAFLTRERLRQDPGWENRSNGHPW